MLLCKVVGMILPVVLVVACQHAPRQMVTSLVDKEARWQDIAGNMDEATSIMHRLLRVSTIPPSRAKQADLLFLHKFSEVNAKSWGGCFITVDDARKWIPPAILIASGVLWMDKLMGDNMLTVWMLSHEIGHLETVAESDSCESNVEDYKNDPYGREFDADLRSLILLLKAGFDPHIAMEGLRRLCEAEGGRCFEHTGNYPAVSDRMEVLREHLSYVEQGTSFFFR